MKKIGLLLLTVLSVCLATSGCGKKSESPPPPPTQQTAPATPAPQPAETEMTTQSGETLRGFTVHFINKETNWIPNTVGVATRISPTETKEIPKEKLRGMRVTKVDRDEKGEIDRMHVVYTTADGEITGMAGPSGFFEVQLHISPKKALSEEELKRLFPKQLGFHRNYEVHDVGGEQFIRVPLCQLKSVTLPAGAVGDRRGAGSK